MVCLGSLSATAQSNFIVDRHTDTADGEGLRGDLRYCITNAISGDTITFEVTGTINLTGPLPALSRNLAIEGPGANLLTVRRDTGGSYRIFMVGSEATVLISGLTISRGDLRLGGGGIANGGVLTLRNVTISGNTSSGASGGGIWNNGTLMISNSTVYGNDASSYFRDAVGGGIYNQGSLTIDSTTISNNVARGHDPECFGIRAEGGGIANIGTLIISNSNILRNDTHLTCGEHPKGGGIYNSGNLTINNSTVSQNGTIVSYYPTELGGGMYNSGTLAINNCSIADNRTNFQGGGVFNADQGILTMRNSILARNIFIYGGGSDLSGRLTSSGYNLIGNTSGGSGFDVLTDLLNIDPMLGPLQDNGGLTWTHALLPGSSAIDAGDNTEAPEWDQRGPSFPRIVNGRIDIGAFEVQADTDARQR